jgi:K+-sensing histidine kinase KdpD
VVGMDLTASCREMLTWVLTKQAQPGDHIVAVHVSAFSALVRHPAASASAAAESGKELLLLPGSATGTHQQQQQQQELRKSLEGMLSVFQGLCNLKQVKLELEIIRGSKVKKALVEFAAKQDASKLVLGSCNKHFIIGWVYTLLNHIKTHHSFNFYSCIPPA